MDYLKRWIMTLVGLIMFFHSISLYAVPSSDPGNKDSVAMTEDAESPSSQICSYEALIPSAQGMVPLVMYYLGEVVVLHESEAPEFQPVVYHYHSYRDILFPGIINPNGP